MTNLQKTGRGFLVLVFGTGFWCVCHWHKVMIPYERVTAAANDVIETTTNGVTMTSANVTAHPQSQDPDNYSVWTARMSVDM